MNFKTAFHFFVNINILLYDIIKGERNAKNTSEIKETKTSNNTGNIKNEKNSAKISGFKKIFLEQQYGE